MKIKKIIFASLLLGYGLLMYHLQAQTPPPVVSATRGNLNCTLRYSAISKIVSVNCIDNGVVVLNAIVNPEAVAGTGVTCAVNGTESNTVASILTKSPAGVVTWQVGANGKVGNGNF